MLHTLLDALLVLSQSLYRLLKRAAIITARLGQTNMTAEVTTPNKYTVNSTEDKQASRWRQREHYRDMSESICATEQHIRATLFLYLHSFIFNADAWLR